MEFIPIAQSSLILPPNADDDLDLPDDRDISQRQLGWHVANVARSPFGARLQGLLIRQVRRMLGAPEEDIDLDEADLEEFPAEARPLFDPSRSRRQAAARTALEAYVNLPDDETLETNLAWAASEFGFDGVETAIVRLLMLYQEHMELEHFADRLLQSLSAPAQAVAALIGEAPRVVVERLKDTSPLAACGFVSLQPDKNQFGLAGDTGVIQVPRALHRTMRTPFGTRGAWLAAMCGEPAGASLTWDDFAHLGPDRDLALGVLSGAAAKHERGVNILLHGPVGAGKTEFCKALAARLATPIWPVGEADRDGDDLVRQQRLGAMRLAQRLLARRERALILLDEAEDVLVRSAHIVGRAESVCQSGSKVFLSRLLERNAVPVLWTCNSLRDMDPAVLRRMTACIEVRKPNRAVRARIWRKVAAETGATIGEADVERLAARYDVAPALIANAARAAGLAGGGATEAEAALTGSLRALGRKLAPPALEAGDFDPALTRCDEDLSRLADRLAGDGAPRAWSLLIQGPPGTGKSHFARHLAGQLGLEVSHKRASDLLSMWVGGTEQAIAEAFADARAEGSLLIFDEADSLLAERAGAQRSWEVSQVNEMLTWMESHPLPFVCTTNLAERLDRASLRRFTFKLTFETLTGAQAALAFRRFFGLEPPAGLPDGLAPGDFALIERRRGLLGTDDPAVLARWLEEEVEAKGARARRMGFHLSSTQNL